MDAGPASDGGGLPHQEDERVVLLIEDNTGDAELVRDYLDEAHSLRYEVRHVPTLAEGIASLREQNFDAVLLDLRLPDGEGVASVKALRAHAEKLPIVVLTGADDELALSCLDAGAQDFLIKNEIRGLALRRSIEYAISRLRESQLRELFNQRLGQIVASSPATLYTLQVEPDGELRHDWVSENVERLTGFPAAEVGQSWWLDHLHPDDRDWVLENGRRLLADGALQREYRVLRRDGEYRWIRDEQLLVRDAAGQPKQIVGSWFDISERRRLEQQLRQSQKMDAIGQLAGGVAHDFNNLLGVIIGYCEMMELELEGNGRVLQRLEEVTKAARRAAELTRQLLAFSRQQVLEPKVLDLGEVVEKTSGMLSRLIGDDIDLDVRVRSFASRVLADPGQIEQVIVNLAVNARDAMPLGGRLLLETGCVQVDESSTWIKPGLEPGDYVQLAVSDTGCGMSAEVAAKIFEPFFTTKEAGKGTGLGLSTVYGIVKQSGGSISVYSEPGQGTTFKILLPRVDRELDLPASPPPPLRKGSETILLLEDSEPLRLVLHEMLENAGYRVIDGADLDDTLARAFSHKGTIDLVLSDVVMPGASGPEVVARLRARRPEVRTIFMSGYTDDAIGRHGILEPGTFFLQKPFSSRALRDKIREVLDGGS